MELVLDERLTNRNGVFGFQSIFLPAQTEPLDVFPFFILVHFLFLFGREIPAFGIPSIVQEPVQILVGHAQGS